METLTLNEFVSYFSVLCICNLAFIFKLDINQCLYKKGNTKL